ncbi:septum site-determining protein MinC [Taklimakanibacter lacteus]|uniref:septum site-determining protein MinC n=1 Tax=Taklimakanibacter lacteus TaxID=2268456 RepID=UPI000E66923D
MSIASQQRTMRFLGRSYMAFVFTPEGPIIEWLAQLDSWLARSPGFFAGRPVVLDLANVKLHRPGISHLVGCLLERDIRVIGLEGADPAQLGPDLPPLLSGRPVNSTEIVALTRPEQPPAPAPAPKQAASLLIDRPVRSGQSIIHPDGDVSVLGSVGSGAEIVAGGSIHIYGTLRGRAMAGHMGNSQARIFCQKIEAELLAINGYYRTAEELDASYRSRPMQAWLNDNVMMITALN